MLNNYLKIAIRHLFRNKSYTLINIFGLAIGIACCLLILLFVQDELSYDKFHEKGDRIHRMSLIRKYPGRERKYAIIPSGYGDIMKKEFPEVEEVCRLAFFPGTQLFKKGEEIYEEEHYVWSDSTFFQVFDIPLLMGDEKAALSPPNAIILTETMSKKYFGEENPIGKIMDIPQNDQDLQVTGVCADVPENSHLKFDYILSSNALNFWQQPNYLSFSAYTYLLLSPNVNPQELERKFDDLVVKYASGQVLNNFGVDYQEYQQQGNGYEYFLQALPEIYLTSNLENELKPPGSKSRVYFFLIVAILILVIACINFMNLATARSAERAREVGIRKTLGSERSEIAWQFIFESITISFVSTILAWGILQYFIPAFNELSGKNFAVSDVVNWQYLPGLMGLAIIVGLMAGIYPAFVLSGFKPLEVLRGNFKNTRSGHLLRNLLVGFQFFISIGLIIGTLVVYHQLEFIQNTTLGFDKEHLISVTGGQRLTAQQSETFKNQIKNLPGVKAVGGCNNMPGGYYIGMSMQPKGANEMTTGSAVMIDEGYIDCMNMEIIAGRAFSDDFTDTLSVIVNESAVKEMGLEDPIGQLLTSNDNNLNHDPNNPSAYTIIGVVKDFHFQSMHNVISPLFLHHNFRNFQANIDPMITIRLAPNNFKQTISEIDQIWTQFQPENPFNYTFMDKDWGALYAKEEIQRNVFWRFSLLAIFIACMGLLGLAAYITQQRRKEIGIRKVLGASIPSIIGLLSRDFLKLVLIAFLIAVPLSWYFSQQWLAEFAYSIQLQWWMFALAGGLAVSIAFLTVSYQSIKAALMNPIASLKDD